MSLQEEQHTAVAVTAAGDELDSAVAVKSSSRNEDVIYAGTPAKCNPHSEQNAAADAAGEQRIVVSNGTRDDHQEGEVEEDGTASSKESATHEASSASETAAKMLAKAEASVAKGLSKCNDWLRARDLFYEAGALFSTCGYAESAAKAFLHASVITHAFKDEVEVVSMLSLAADNLQVVQPAIAVDVLNTLSNSFAKSGLTIQAARCKRNAAELLDYRLDMPDKAIQMYKDAIQLFSDRSVTKSFIRCCMARITALTVIQMRFSEASELFMDEAKMVQRFLPKTKQFLYSLLCLLANGFGDDDRYFDALYTTHKRFEELQEEEKNFQQGKEYALMRSLIEANDHGSLNEFDIAVFTYKSCSTFKHDPIFDILVNRCRANLYEHMEQYM